HTRRNFKSTTLAGARFAFDGDALRSQQSEPSIGSHGQRVDVETRGCLVGRLHDRRRRGKNGDAAAFSDPVDVPVTVHQDRPTAERLERPNEPIAVDQAVPTRSDSAFAALGYSTT